MDFVIENIRLRELVAVVGENRIFFEDFVGFLEGEGFPSLQDFVNSDDDEKALSTISRYLSRRSDARLFDGLGKPYHNSKARWFFLSWLFRDVPAQRLGPLVQHVQGKTSLERKTNLLNELRKHVGPLFPNPASWE